MIVVKVGGSLFDHPNLGPALREFVAGLAPAEVLLIAGGGPVADAVRQLDTVHGLGEETAHWLALRSLGVTADLLLSLTSPLEGEVGEALRAGWGGRALASPSVSPPTRRVQSDAATSPSRGEVKGKAGSRLTVLDCFTFAQEDESRPGALPHSWSVTTDSLAARVAAVYRAERLYLLKSVDVPSETPWETAAANGWVDAHFPQVAATLSCPISVINFRRKLQTRA